MKFKLFDVSWKVEILSHQKFEKMNDYEEHDIAVTDFDKRIVSFSEDHFNLNVIRHELFHIYFDATNTSSASLTPEQIEEVAADIIGKHCEDINKLAKLIYRNLK